MRVGLTQFDIKWEDKDFNMKNCERLIKKAKLKDVDLIIFPEMTLTGFSNDVKKISEEYENSKTITFFNKMSKNYNIGIIFGYVEKVGDEMFNKLGISLLGEIVLQYTKIHSFSFANEDIYYKDGNSLSSINLFGINIGVFICYDLRFPEVFQASSKKNDVIIIIANWCKDRVEHWRTLLKARAIENQCYIIGVNRIGEGNGLLYEESSEIYSPQGKLIAGDIKNEDLIIADIDTLEVKTYRNNFKLKQDRKIEFYKNIL